MSVLQYPVDNIVIETILKSKFYIRLSHSVYFIKAINNLMKENRKYNLTENLSVCEIICDLWSLMEKPRSIKAEAGKSILAIKIAIINLAI